VETEILQFSLWKGIQPRGIFLMLWSLCSFVGLSWRVIEANITPSRSSRLSPCDKTIAGSFVLSNFDGILISRLLADGCCQRLFKFDRNLLLGVL
jgi:hypothetical protein